MGSLTITQIGSVLLNMIENVPNAISGTLPNFVNQEIYFAEKFTGDSIGTTVADEYQPAIISLTASSILRMMELQGIDVNSFKLGDLSINKGQGSSTSTSSDMLRKDGIEKLNNLGYEINYYKAYA